MAQAAVADVPRLIAELRGHIVKITKKPLDHVVESLTAQIEVRSACQPYNNEWAGIEFSRTERRLIDALAARPGMTFSKEALLNAIYFDHVGDEPDAKILDVFVHKVRTKLIAADANCWVATAWGVGYKFVRENAREALKACDKASIRYRESRSVEWQGVVMGVKQARIAEALHKRLGQWTASGAIAKDAGVWAQSLAAQVRYISNALLPTNLAIEHRHGFGYRMVVSG